MDARSPLLDEREQTHGDFRITALVSQTLKGVIRRYEGGLTHRQLEALDMIMVKIARIISGDANCVEHWGDIVGYAELGMEGCCDSRGEDQGEGQGSDNKTLP